MNARELNIIRGKNLVGKATQDDVTALFEYVDKLEGLLDDADEYDTYGTQGWRYFAGCE